MEWADWETITATTYGEPCDCEWYAISEGVS